MEEAHKTLSASPLLFRFSPCRQTRPLSLSLKHIHTYTHTHAHSLAREEQTTRMPPCRVEKSAKAPPSAASKRE